jgi:hypothetical protein
MPDAVFLMQDRDTEHFCRLYDSSLSRPIRRIVLAGIVDRSDELHMVIESVPPDARQTRREHPPVPIDGARGSSIG